MILSKKMQDMIRPMLHHDCTHTMESLQKKLNDNSAKLFNNNSALIITQLLQYPLARVTHIWMGAGDLNGIKSLLPEVENYAKEMDCSRLEFSGREGWKRWTEDNDLGWTMKSIMMKKELA